MTSSIQLKLLLVKEHLKTFEEVFDSDTEGTDFPLDPDLDWDATFRLRTMPPKTPSWVAKIRPLLEDSLPAIKTQSSGAVLLLRVQDRIVALTWGYGRTLLRNDSFERDFGLRVVLNTVDAENVRSVDSQTIEEITVSTRRQTSRASDFVNFGLDSSQDLLRGVTGIPRDPDFASRISGSDALTVGLELDLPGLSEKCEEFLEAYTADRYKDRFGFIDHMKIERDPAVISELSQNLVRDLEAGNTDQMHLAPMGPEDWENISGFTYSLSSTAPVFPDLDIEEALQHMHPNTQFSIEYLRRKYIGVRYREAEESVDKYSAFSCLVYETEINDQLYVLSGGDWHQIDRDWSEGVRRRVSEIPESSVALPSSWAGELEGNYNARVAAEMDWALMHGRIISLAPPYDRVEMCDLLTPTGQFIHVKRDTVSSTLSHLFAQGRISGDLFFRSADYRQQCRRKAVEGNPEWGNLIEISRPDPDQHEIVYAILARTRPNWPRSLPFFSQLNLDNTARDLSTLGYHVSLQHVPANP